MKFEDIINSEEKVKSFIVLMVIGIALAVIIGIYSLIKIWSPSDENTEEVQKVLGTYEFVKISEEQMAKRYFSNVFVHMYNEDYQTLYGLLDPLYVKENNVTVDSLRTYIQNKGMSGTDIILEKYDMKEIEGQRVYTLQVQSADGSKMEKIIVKEKSPKNITISFGSKLYYEDTGNKETKDGLEYECLSVEDEGTQITVKVKITNISTYNISINKEKAIFAVKAISDKNTLINSVSDTVSSRTIELTPQQTFTYIGVFRKDDYQTIKGIKIDKVYNATSNIEIASEYIF